MGFPFNAEKLCAARTVHRLTVTDLARLAECSQPQMSRLLAGQRGISARVLQALAATLGITDEYLEVDYTRPMGTDASQWW